MPAQTVARRTFLLSAGASVAGVRWPAAAGAAGGGTDAGRRNEPLKIGLASYSLRNFPLERALEMAQAAGVRYMTFKDVHIPRTDPPDRIRANRARIEAAGITIMGGGTINMPNDPAQIRKDFEY